MLMTLGIIVGTWVGIAGACVWEWDERRSGKFTLRYGEMCERAVRRDQELYERACREQDVARGIPARESRR